MCRVELIGAVHTARCNDVHGELAFKKCTNLHGRGVCAQQQVTICGLNKERVLHGPCRVIGVETESVKVEPLVFKLGPLRDLPPHTNKDVADFILQLCKRVTRARTHPYRRSRHIDGLGNQPLCHLKFNKHRLARTKCTLNAPAGLPHELAGRRLLIFGHLPHERVEPCDWGPVASVFGTGRLQLRDGGCFSKSGKRGLNRCLRCFWGDRVRV